MKKSIRIGAATVELLMVFSLMFGVAGGVAYYGLAMIPTYSRMNGTTDIFLYMIVAVFALFCGAIAGRVLQKILHPFRQATPPEYY